MNVSSGASPRTLPQALILALLVGGTGAFLAEEPRGDERVTEAADLLPDGAVAVDAAGASGAATQHGAGTAALPSPRSVDSLALPQMPSTPSAPELPHRPRHAKPHHRAAEPAHVSDHAVIAAGHGRHRAGAFTDLSSLSHVTGDLDWGALARCESGGNPHITDPSGRYGGLYQFDAHTWHSLGGHGLPQNASASEQTSRARTLFHERGTAPWPSCGHRAHG
ncbi:transglycosylase family protein [Streptacidiphilus rugosus]|uniref:transglycosylase family protein n=1 Tax=Streptacidiphilus rugosus TaxID=405783 RepID=UPI000AF53F6E